MKNKGLTGSWFFWLIIFLAILALGFLSYSIYKEFYNKKQVESEIDELKKQAEKIKQENMSLEEKINYIGSEEYQKIQAKDKLDLQDPRENVVVITQKPSLVNENAVVKESDRKIQSPNYSQKDSNFLKWWNYFFK